LVDDRIHAVQDKLENDPLQLDPVAPYTGAEAKRSVTSFDIADQRLNGRKAEHITQRLIKINDLGVEFRFLQQTAQMSDHFARARVVAAYVG
jgi:hypothetical protein